MSETYTANSAFMRANLDTATRLGLVDWDVDTWTLITGADIQYLIGWDRTIVTLTSNPVYYHTESFESSNAHVQVNGDSETWANIIDVDIPTGVQLYGHELRTGGYYRWTGLYGGISDGLHESSLNEVHGRIVLDFLSQLWKVQWIGIGGSYGATHVIDCAHIPRSCGSGSGTRSRDAAAIPAAAGAGARAAAWWCAGGL
jgi:hypothetical protein